VFLLSARKPLETLRVSEAKVAEALKGLGFRVRDPYPKDWRERLRRVGLEGEAVIRFEEPVHVDLIPLPSDRVYRAVAVEDRDVGLKEVRVSSVVYDPEGPFFTNDVTLYRGGERLLTLHIPSHTELLSLLAHPSVRRVVEGGGASFTSRAFGEAVLDFLGAVDGAAEQVGPYAMREILRSMTFRSRYSTGEGRWLLAVSLGRGDYAYDNFVIYRVADFRHDLTHLVPRSSEGDFLRRVERGFPLRVLRYGVNWAIAYGGGGGGAEWYLGADLGTTVRVIYGEGVERLLPIGKIERVSEGLSAKVAEALRRLALSYVGLRYLVSHYVGWSA